MHLLCLLAGHERSRNVWHDSLDFRSRCKRCGIPMIRDGITGKWRPFDGPTDHDIARHPHP